MAGINQQQLEGPNQDTFRIGLTFESFEDFTIFKGKYEKTKHVQMYIFGSRSIEAARKQGIKQELASDLKYDEISYKCIYGGQWVSSSTGESPNRTSLKQGCPFALRLKASMDGKCLEVVHFVGNHNHTLTEKRYNFLPKQTHMGEKGNQFAKLRMQFQEEEKLLQTRLLLSSPEVTIRDLEADKKLLQAKLLPTPRVTSKDLQADKRLQNTELLVPEVPLEDLHNIKKPLDKYTLQSVLQYLMQKETGTVLLVKNEKNVFMGIFYQDEEMKRMFSCYPEVIFIDTFYEVSNLGTSLCILAIEDGNGETEIVGLFLITTEEKKSISKMAQLFKTHNANWIKTKAIMCDKDFLERKTFHEEFPKASLNICLFHSLRSFRREITTEKMGIKTGEKEICLELLQQMAHAKNETDYMKLKDVLIKTNVIPVKKYFTENWHPIKKEWVVALQNTSTFQNKTKNRIESMSYKVIQVVKKHLSLLDLVKNLDNFIMTHRLEKDCKVAQIDLKPSLLITSNEDQKKYLDLLTPYAYGIIANKFKLVNVVIVEGDPFTKNVRVKSSSGTQYVTTTKCTCRFFTNMGLPCHHILKVRQLNLLRLFSPHLVAPRWTKSYYIMSSRIVSRGKLSNDSLSNVLLSNDLLSNDLLSNDSLSNDSLNNDSLITSTVKTKQIMRKDKLRLVKNRANKIAGLAYESSSRTFPRIIDAMDKIIELWEANKEVGMNELEVKTTNQNPQPRKKQRSENTETDNIELFMPQSSESPSSPGIALLKLKPVARKSFLSSKPPKTMFKKYK